MGDGPDLYPIKSSSRASLGKGLKSKENNIDECDELSDGSPIESTGSVQDQVNINALEADIGALEADSRQFQFNQQNGEAPYSLDKTAMPLMAAPGEYYNGSNIGVARSISSLNNEPPSGMLMHSTDGKQLPLTDPLAVEQGLMLPNAPPIGLEFGMDMTGQEAAALDEVSRLTLENEQLKIDRNQLQKQLNNAMKKKPLDFATINTTPTEGHLAIQQHGVTDG